MTQLGEPLKIAQVKDFGIDCPFPHEDCPHTDSKNVFEGNAETLGLNLDKPSVAGSTVTRTTKPFQDARLASAHELEPKVPPRGHKDKKDWENWIQLVKGNERTWYPVGFQAHHLIPAAASLKGSEILKYMASGGSGSRVCCNLGYDVNGKENGVWLPGKHAVAGGDLGINLWGSAKRALPAEEEFQRPGVARGPRDDSLGSDSNRYLPLSGKTPSKKNLDKLSEVFHERNLKHLYVKRAMQITSPPRQFHDVHPKYSAKVKSHLKAIAAVLEDFHRVGEEAGDCTQGCKDRKKVPPSPQMLKLINRLSQGYKTRFLVGKTAHDEYFTSNWCRKGLTKGE
jgi:hypothetical protein